MKRFNIFNILSFVIVILIIFMFLKFKIFAFLIEPTNVYYIIILAKQHILMVFFSMIFATVLGIAFGIVVTRNIIRSFTFFTMYIINLGQAIPVLAILALSMVYFGIGFKCAVFALTICSILPITSNTIAGINNIDSVIIDAAKGIGLSNYKILREIELPLSSPVMLTGIRTALIINVATASLGSLIGAGGFGELVFAGIYLMDPARLITGGLLTTSLALGVDYISVKCFKLLIPKGISK
jgi:osmoprotectant transport system permease protein